MTGNYMFNAQLRNLDHDIVDFAHQVWSLCGNAWIVGGAVRDWALGLSPKDIDIEVSNISPGTLESMQGWDVFEAGNRFGVWLVKRPGSSASQAFEVALPHVRVRTGNGHNDEVAIVDPNTPIHKSLARRDFTMNAVAVNVLTGEVVDPFDGLSDLESGVLQAIDSDNFGADPLRVLRGMQFCSRFNLVATDDTLESARVWLAGFDTLSPNRVRGEWEKWVGGSFPAAGIRFLRDCGWLVHFPLLAGMEITEQDEIWHPEGDVLEHTIQALENVASSDPVVVWSVLLHDIGKVWTTVSDETTGRIVSPGHAQESAGAVVEFFRSAGWNIGTRVPAFIQAVQACVNSHMWLASFQGTPSNRAVRRLASSLGNATVRQWAQVCLADISGRGTAVNEDDIDAILAVADAAGDLEIFDAQPEPMVSGRHLMAVGLRHDNDTCHFGAILDATFQAQLDGEFDNVDDGVRWAWNWWMVQSVSAVS